MFTKKTNDHNHRMEVDGQGTGETLDTSKGLPHTHKIDNWKVEEKNGHTHAVSSDYIQGTTEYGNGDESVTIVGEGESMKEKVDKITEGLKVEVSVKVCD